MQLVPDFENSPLKFMDPSQLEAANARRRALLEAIGDRATHAFKESKPHTGELSPGCARCGEGSWSCNFLNRVCNAKCFFCPGGMTQPDAPPVAERIVFSSAEDYAAYVEQVGFRGVSFSGGDPFLTIDLLVEFLAAVRARLGDAVYLWAYTNGGPVTEETLRRAVEAGLQEIRFDITDHDYALDKVGLAVGIVPRVTIEIPAIPEDGERLRALLPTFQELGVDHLNLHQMMLLGDNASALLEHDYTFVRNATPPVLESELSALETILFALDQGIELPINYCAMAYKDRWQNRGYDQLAADLVLAGYESRAESGLVRRLWLQADPDKLAAVVAGLREQEVDPERYALDEARSVLFLHPSLLGRIGDLDALRVSLQYLKARAGERDTSEYAQQVPDYHDLELTPSLTIGVCLYAVCAPVVLDKEDVAGLIEGRSSDTLRPYEELAQGLPDYV